MKSALAGGSALSGSKPVQQPLSIHCCQQVYTNCRQDLFCTMDWSVCQHSLLVMHLFLNVFFFFSNTVVSVVSAQSSVYAWAHVDWPFEPVHPLPLEHSDSGSCGSTTGPVSSFASHLGADWSCTAEFSCCWIAAWHILTWQVHTLPWYKRKCV